MRPNIKKKLIFAAAASSGLLGLLGYPAIKSVYPIKKRTTILNDYVDLPTATADLTKDVSVPEGVGASSDVPINISHWLLLSLLKSTNTSRRERVLNELARQRRWNDAECLEIAQALDKQDIVKLARTVDADIRLFLPPPSVEFIEKTLDSSRIEKLVKSILKDVSENNDSCSSCTNFYTSLSIRVRPDSNILAMSELDQVDKMMRMKSRKRTKTAYNEDVIRLKAVLNNVLCSEQQALSMVESGMLMALLYFRHKYENDLQVNGLLSQILANLTSKKSTQDYVFINGWIQTLINYSRSEHLELSMPAIKALANLDDEATKLNGVYGNHLYLLSPIYRSGEEPIFDIVFVHGLVGSIFKSWRQGSIPLDDYGCLKNSNDNNLVTELLPNGPAEYTSNEDSNSPNGRLKNSHIITENTYTRCWPKDWLPQDVTGLRILAVDYPTALSNWRTDCDLSKDNLRMRAIHVMKQLEEAKLGSRPIIWVTHSMGGLLVKQILVLCDEYLGQRISSVSPLHNEELETSLEFKEKLLEQTKGVVFYSVPHKGSNLDWIERRNLQKILMLTTEVIELQKGSPVLMDLHQKFLNLSNREIKYLTFAENSASSFGVNRVVQWKGILVHEDSLYFETGPIFKLSIDHAHTCKPSSKNDITYVKTLDFIRDLVPRTPENEFEKILPYISFITSSF